MTLLHHARRGSDGVGVKKRNPRIIQDKKLRGEWAESVFMERATQHGLAVSKPWGEMNSYDFVIGKSGRFLSVQVKSTISPFKTGYDCTVRGGHKAYRAGSFDFLAAYAVLDDAWYIIPADLIRGKKSVTLFPNSKTAKYEPYREAWHLLKEAAGSGLGQTGQDAAGVNDDARDDVARADDPTSRKSGEGTQTRFPTSALGRMQAAFDFARRQMQGNQLRSEEKDEES